MPKSSSGGQPPKKEEFPFTLIKDESFIAKLIDTVSRHQIPMTVWFKEQSPRFESKTKEYLQHLKKWQVHLPSEIGLEAFSAAIKRQGHPQLFVSFQIDSVNYFIKTEATGALSPEAFALAIPKEAFKLQRRANMRITFKRHEAPKVSCISPSAENKATVKAEDILHFRMLDISAGGMAIAVPIEQKDLLGIGKIMKDVRFSLRGADIVCNTVIRHHKPAESDQGKAILRIGLEFTAIRPQFERWIAQFVLDESRRVFSILY